MWHKEIELERMGCARSGWAYQQWSAGEGINRWWEKNLTPSTQRLSLSKENIRNVKHRGMFTHLSVIQIFRLRLGPDVHQIPANPRGMVRPNLPQSMWPRLESRGKRRNVCLRLCVLCISSCQMWTLSNAAAFQMTASVTEGHHLEERVSHEIFSRGKPQHHFFIRSGTESSYIEHWLHYVTLGSIRGRHEPHQPTVSIWWHHYDSWNQTSSTYLSAYKHSGNGREYNKKRCWSIKLSYNFITAHSWGCSFRFERQLSFPSVTLAIQERAGQTSSSISA